MAGWESEQTFLKPLWVKNLEMLTPFDSVISLLRIFLKELVKSLSRAQLFATPWIVACTKLLHPWDFQGKSTAISFSREFSQPRDWTQVSHIVDRRLPSEPPGR